MDAPESPPAGGPPPAAAVAPYEDSPVFSFINSLSPIVTLKPLNSARNDQSCMGPDVAHISSIFTSSQFKPQKESKFIIRDDFVQLSQKYPNPDCQRSQIGTASCIEVSESTTMVKENCSHSEDTTILLSNWPQSISLGKEEDTDDKTDHTVDVGQVKLSSTCSDQNALDGMDSSTSVRNVQEIELAKQYNDPLAACNSNNLLTHCGTGTSVISKSDLFSEAQPLNWKVRSDDVISSKCFMPTDQGNLEDSRIKLLDATVCVADYIHDYCTTAAERVAINRDPETLPGTIQSQLVLNDCFFDKLKVPSDNTLMDNALLQHHCGMHRRSLFNGKLGSSDFNRQSFSNPYHASICGDNYLNPVASPACQLTGIGLHLNAVTPDSSNNMLFTINSPMLPEHNSPTTVVSGSEMVFYSSNIQNDYASQKTMPNAAESPQETHKKKSRKLQKGDGDSCRRCNCKKSKCLKLYCACFAAKVYCSGLCSYQGCMNNHANKETVLCIRKRTESRNPLAFAPTVTRMCGSDPDFGGNSNKTPASARHKRGCNCRKSSCLKKYCECFQSGVGCSACCRCESCKNSFGRREGVPLLTTDENMDKENNENGAHAKEENVAFDKQLMVAQSGDLPSVDKILTTPSIEPCRSSVLPLAEWSSQLHNPQSPMKADVLLSPFETYDAEMVLGNDSSDIQKGDPSFTTSIKVVSVSPNKKRVSPLRIGTGLSPVSRSGRKLFLKSIPSFPSLTGGDVDSELASPTKQSKSSSAFAN